MMKALLTLGAALAAVTVAGPGSATAANPIPFPSATVVQLFVAAQTVTPDGAMANMFAPGSVVTFRAYAVDPSTKKVLAAKDVRFFYVTIPNQPNVKLTYNASAPGASKGLPWTGRWTVPAAYPAGPVAFKVLVQAATKSKSGQQRRGQFVQFPVSSAMLTISPTAPAPYTPGVDAGVAGAGSGTLQLSLYVDTVNGTRPSGIAPRPIGCTQTNVYKRGEQVVVRSWGTDLTTNELLSSDNVAEAHFSIAGQPDVTLNWGPHGVAGSQVFFWSNFWIVPASFPLGETTIHVSVKTESGRTGAYDQVINVIP